MMKDNEQSMETPSYTQLSGQAYTLLEIEIVRQYPPPKLALPVDPWMAPTPPICPNRSTALFVFVLGLDRVGCQIKLSLVSSFVIVG